MAFLLDGLHEDLNLVREKPYVDMTVKTNNRPEKVRLIFISMCLCWWGRGGGGGERRGGGLTVGWTYKYMYVTMVTKSTAYM